MKSLLFLLGLVVLAMQQESIVFCDEAVQFSNATYGNLVTNLKLDNSTDVILTTNSILIIDDNLELLSTLTNPQNITHKCYLPFKHSSDLFFLGCQSNSSAPYIIGYKRINRTHYENFGNTVYLSTLVAPVSKFDVAENTLFAQQKEKVTLFTIVVQAADWNIKTTSFVFDNNYFGASSVNLTDITFKSYIQDSALYYKILVTEYKLGAYWIDALVKNNVLSPFRSGQIKLSTYFTYTHYFTSSIIHSTNQTQTNFVINSANQGIEAIKAVFNSVTSTTFSQLATFSTYQGWPVVSRLIKSNNVFGEISESSLKQHAVGLFNYIIPNVGDPNVGETSVVIDSIEASVGLDPVDVLTEPPNDYSFAYFNSYNRVVHTYNADHLQSCDLYNYKIK